MRELRVSIASLGCLLLTCFCSLARAQDAPQNCPLLSASQQDADTYLFRIPVTEDWTEEASLRLRNSITPVAYPALTSINSSLNANTHPNAILRDNARFEFVCQFIVDCLNHGLSAPRYFIQQQVYIDDLNFCTIRDSQYVADPEADRTSAWASPTEVSETIGEKLGPSVELLLQRMMEMWGVVDPSDQQIHDLRALARTLASTAVLPEPLARLQGDFDNLNPDSAWGVNAINCRSVWEFTTGQNVLVAVVDTGVWAEHPELKANVVQTDAAPFDVHACNVYLNCMDTAIAGKSGPLHGTFISGIICSKVNLGRGDTAVGVAPDCNILPIQICFEGDGYLRMGDSVAGVMLASKLGAKVINCSWGMPGAGKYKRPMPEYVKMLRLAGSNNSLLVCAAGNSGQPDGIADEPFYPASIPQAVSVSSIARRMPLGNLEQDLGNCHWSVDIMAPGSSLTVCSIPSGGKKDLFASNASGTSFATAFASGVAALLWASRPSATAAEVHTALLQSNTSVPMSLHPRRRRPVLDAVCAYLALP